MLDLSELVDLCGDYKNSAGSEEYSFCCPKCGDTRYRLFINIEKRTYICFNEGCKIDLPEDKKYAPTITDLKSLMMKSKDGEVKVHEIAYPEYIIEPSDDVAYKPYWDYLYKRNLKITDIIDYRIMFGRKGSVLENRVIFPVYYNSLLVYYQARAIDSREPRYIGSEVGETNKKSWFLVNYDVAKTYEEVIICEGFLNAIFAGKNAVACLGKFISNIQFDLLIKTWNKFTIALDKDAYENALSLHKRLTRHGKEARLINFKDNRDIADLGRAEFLKLTREAGYSVYDHLRSRLEKVFNG